MACVGDALVSAIWDKQHELERGLSNSEMSPLLGVPALMVRTTVSQLKESHPYPIVCVLVVESGLPWSGQVAWHVTRETVYPHIVGGGVVSV